MGSVQTQKSGPILDTQMQLPWLGAPWMWRYVARVEENADLYFNSFTTFKRTYNCQKAQSLLI